MNTNLRKYLIGLISFGLLLVIYILYNRINQTPRISIGANEEFVDSPPDIDIENFDSDTAKIGSVGVVGIKRPRFLHRNKFNEVDREFGFEELLHEDGNQWEIEKPYLNLFLPMLRCYIIADRGQVQVETAAGRPSPKDAEFTGNVLIHIIPTVGSDIKESSIYLDDVAFVSEKALIYTAGPVSFISEDAEMRGTGLELSYNDELARLEFFRIVQLDSLLMKSSQVPFLAANTAEFSRDADILADTAGTNTSTSRESTIRSMQTTNVPKNDKGQYYKCVFAKNVVIQTPEQRIYASKGLYLNNIFWLKNKSEKSSTSVISDSNYAEMGDATTLRAIPKDKSSEESSFDVMVHCNGGVIVTPMDSSRVPSDFYGESNVQTYTVDEKGLVDSGDSSKQSVLVTQRIDYDLSNGQTTVIGPLELTFQVDANSVTGMEDKGGGTLLPAKLTAQKEARFFPSSKQLLLEDDCLVEVFSKDPNMNIEEKYTLSAPRLMIDFPKNRNEQKQVSVGDFEHLTADGGPVKLSAIKRSNMDVLGGVELNCDKLDYEPNKQHFAASGTGQIRLNNSKSDQATEQQRLSLRQPCYAFLRDFDLLEYDMKTRVIIADAKSQQVILDYFPIVNGRYDKHITATAGHVEAGLIQTDDGQIELRSLLATDGIFYEDDENVFVGSKLTYSPDDSGIKITGDESYSCYFNGVAVDKIEIDMKTGTAKAEVLSAGSFQIDRR